MNFFVGFPSGGGGNPITNAGPGGFKAVKNDLIAEVRILFFKFSHNLSRFALTREDDIKISRAKSWAIANSFYTYTKYPFCQLILKVNSTVFTWTKKQTFFFLFLSWRYIALWVWAPLKEIYFFLKYDVLHITKVRLIVWNFHNLFIWMKKAF